MNKVSPFHSSSMLTLTTGNQLVLRCQDLIEEYDFTSICLVSQYLTCLTTSRSQTDKLAFDVGLREHATGKSTFPDLLLSGVSGRIQNLGFQTN